MRHHGRVRTQESVVRTTASMSVSAQSTGPVRDASDVSTAVSLHLIAM